jgi:hypothetical protein
MLSAMRLDKSESHPLTEMQVMMDVFVQLAKDLMNNQRQMFVQFSSQVGHLSSRIDDMETSSNRSRSRSRSRRSSSQHRFVASEILKLRGLRTTVEGIEDKTNDRLSLREERVQSYPETDEFERSLCHLIFVIRC